jgi:hypothetical protein
MGNLSTLWWGEEIEKETDNTIFRKEMYEEKGT